MYNSLFVQILSKIYLVSILISKISSTQTCPYSQTLASDNVTCECDTTLGYVEYPASSEICILDKRTDCYAPAATPDVACTKCNVGFTLFDGACFKSYVSVSDLQALASFEFQIVYPHSALLTDSSIGYDVNTGKYTGPRGLALEAMILSLNVNENAPTITLSAPIDCPAPTADQNIWDSCIALVASGGGDLIPYELTETTERLQAGVFFSLPYYSEKSYLWSKISNKQDTTWAVVLPFTWDLWLMFCVFSLVLALFYTVYEHGFNQVETPVTGGYLANFLAIFYKTVNSLFRNGNIGPAETVPGKIIQFSNVVFCLIFFSLYTASLAMFMSRNKPQLLYQKVTDLLSFNDDSSTYKRLCYDADIAITFENMYTNYEKVTKVLVNYQTMDAATITSLQDSCDAYILTDNSISTNYSRYLYQRCDLYRNTSILFLTVRGLAYNQKYGNLFDMYINNLHKTGMIVPALISYYKQFTTCGTSDSIESKNAPLEYNEIRGLFYLLWMFYALIPIALFCRYILNYLSRAPSGNPDHPNAEFNLEDNNRNNLEDIKSKKENEKDQLQFNGTFTNDNSNTGYGQMRSELKTDSNDSSENKTIENDINDANKKYSGQKLIPNKNKNTDKTDLKMHDIGYKIDESNIDSNLTPIQGSKFEAQIEVENSSSNNSKNSNDHGKLEESEENSLNYKSEDRKNKNNIEIGLVDKSLQKELSKDNHILNDQNIEDKINSKEKEPENKVVESNSEKLENIDIVDTSNKIVESAQVEVTHIDTEKDDNKLIEKEIQKEKEKENEYKSESEVKNEDRKNFSSIKKSKSTLKIKLDDDDELPMQKEEKVEELKEETPREIIEDVKEE